MQHVMWQTTSPPLRCTTLKTPHLLPPCRPASAVFCGSCLSSSSSSSSSGGSHAATSSSAGLHSRGLHPGTTLPCQPLSHRQRRHLACNVSRARQFKNEFEPRSSNVPEDALLTEPLELQALPEPPRLVEIDSPSQYLPSSYWSQGPPGSMRVGASGAQRARLTPLKPPGQLSGVAAATATLFPRQEQFIVELESNYGKQMPGLQIDGSGAVRWRPGFLADIANPDLPNYYFYKALEVFRYSLADQAFQLLVAAAYVATLVGITWALHAYASPMLAASVALSWARNTLSLAKWGLLLGLFFVDKLWVYWAFLAFRVVDGVFVKYLPPLRQVAISLFALWMIYLALAPTWWPALPFITPKFW